MEFIEFLKENNIPFEIKENRLIIYGNVDLSNTQLKELPDCHIVFCGDVNLSHTQIKELKYPMNVCGNLILRDTKIKELPNNIVCGYLYIQNTSITKIPNNLKAYRIYTPVKGKLDIYIEKAGIIGIEWIEKNIEEWKIFFKENKPFNISYYSHLSFNDYNIINRDFKTAVKLLESWRL